MNNPHSSFCWACLTICVCVMECVLIAYPVLEPDGVCWLPLSPFSVRQFSVWKESQAFKALFVNCSSKPPQTLYCCFWSQYPIFSLEGNLLVMVSVAVSHFFWLHVCAPMQMRPLFFWGIKQIDWNGPFWLLSKTSLQFHTLFSFFPIFLPICWLCIVLKPWGIKRKTDWSSWKPLKDGLNICYNSPRTLTH